MSWTAIIPVRGGSKGLQGKNTRLLAGKPLYRHSVDQAITAGAARVIISTDIDEIFSSVMPVGVSVLARPAELCCDDVTMASVLFQIIKVANVTGPVVLLQATSPLRQSVDIQAALEQLAQGSFDLVMSVTEADRGVLKWGQLQPDGGYQPLSIAEYCFANRQSLPSVCKPNGAVYAFHAEWFLSNKSFVSKRLGAILMPSVRSVDIDSAVDFDYCQTFLNLQHSL
jgi:CMP-N-acetylneuraminic acid synthetase